MLACTFDHLIKSRKAKSRHSSRGTLRSCCMWPSSRREAKVAPRRCDARLVKLRSACLLSKWRLWDLTSPAARFKLVDGECRGALYDASTPRGRPESSRARFTERTRVTRKAGSAARASTLDHLLLVNENLGCLEVEAEVLSICKKIASGTNANDTILRPRSSSATIRGSKSVSLC